MLLVRQKLSPSHQRLFRVTFTFTPDQEGQMIFGLSLKVIFDKKKLPALKPGAMSNMVSK